MADISNVSRSAYVPPAPASGNGELAQQLQTQRQDIREAAKPLVETVYISQQAQKQYDIYVQNSASSSEDSSDTNTQQVGFDTQNVLDAQQLVQRRATTVAVYENRQANAAETPQPQPLQPGSLVNTSA
ncbi:hypothetical protein IGB42_04002 [Andreprevotia sp. IGB-42]|uniref:hypothetical protein n=1 Tax=Andreprevotia sp. IGB-42 TaxID=2497473 RepID=UPI00135A9A52|nr:hypothetical protein [Andreprevotia sp. IGB-42]KAF0811545.1 hypothetical protein IGB42_04002 [Andreprevotia sp. IGB-42]